MRHSLYLCQDIEPKRLLLSWDSYTRYIEQKRRICTLHFTVYRNARTPATINGTCIDDFLVGLYQGSVLSPLLFIIMLEALSRECRLLFTKELLYTDEHWKQWLMKYCRT